MIFIKILQIMLKLDLIPQIMNSIELKNKEATGLMKDELGGKIMTKLFRLRAKSYNYLIDDGTKIKEQKAQKSVSQKENYKNFKII